jgi:hypothetical protein
MPPEKNDFVQFNAAKSQITPVLLQIHLCNWAHKPTNGLTSMASIRLCSCENFVILAR